ncbi:hypothetical protein AB0L71_08810 [Streptomyces sp. NPDC052052]|uniref:hypothetical protein n=1 Tax=Streptomyces sp. NPDC052052 TaxID=3154756 RepID=UPI003437E9B1
MSRTPHKETSEIARTLFRDHLVSGPYERLFLTPGEEVEYVHNYLTLLDGILEYKFNIAEYHNLGVIGLQSVLGNVSAVVIEPENLKKLPTFIQDTRTMYVVDSIDAVYEQVEKLGVPILQPRTPNIMGAQGRLQFSSNYIIEIVEATNEDLFHPNPKELGYL